MSLVVATLSKHLMRADAELVRTRDTIVGLVFLSLACVTSYSLVNIWLESFAQNPRHQRVGLDGWLFWAFALAWFALFACWKAVRQSCRLIPRDSRILVIGSKACARQVIRTIQNAREEHDILGCLDPDGSLAGRKVEGASILGPTERLPQYLFSNAVDLVVFALPLELVPNAKAMIDATVQLGVPVAVISNFLKKETGAEIGIRNAFLESLLGHPAVILSNVPRNVTYLAIKRLMDVVISAELLVLLSPLLFVIAILVKVTSPDGPVFYPWKVLGRNGRPFVGYKFRTMVPNADELKKQLLQQNEMQGPVFKMQNDPRVTPLGRFLRKYSLDELPQLYSVLKGDMSLVGPRPPAKDEADQFQSWQRRKLSVTPGITCLWQVNGRSNIKSFDEWARLDLQYIASASLWLDLAILVKTVPVVILGRGAH